jgi:hypothetical protein
MAITTASTISVVETPLDVMEEKLEGLSLNLLEGIPASSTRLCHLSAAVDVETLGTNLLDEGVEMVRDSEMAGARGGEESEGKAKAETRGSISFSVSWMPVVGVALQLLRHSEVWRAMLSGIWERERQAACRTHEEKYLKCTFELREAISSIPMSPRFREMMLRESPKTAI